jgi:8-oxo-dGTP diphosphatase
VDEKEIDGYQRLAGSFNVIICKGQYLICYNKYRGQWELPAGKRESGETPKECAFRELYEETGQLAEELAFKGLLKVINTKNGEIKYNPVYFGELNNLQPFIENEETTQIKLWNGKEEIGCIDPIDMEVLKYI